MSTTVARVSWVAALACAACGTTPPPAAPVVAIAPSAPSAPAQAEPPKPREAPPPDPAETPGLTFEHPIEACGPRQSYEIVARYRCDDGSVPLEGNLRAGQRARVGSTRSHLPHAPGDFANSHIVDLYRVPCPSGPVDLYVCLYHCGDKTPLGPKSASLDLE